MDIFQMSMVKKINNVIIWRHQSVRKQHWAVLKKLTSPRLNRCTKMKFSIKDFFGEIVNGKLDFLCIVTMFIAFLGRDK